MYGHSMIAAWGLSLWLRFKHQSFLSSCYYLKRETELLEFVEKKPLIHCWHWHLENQDSCFQFISPWWQLPGLLKYSWRPRKQPRGCSGEV